MHTGAIAPGLSLGYVEQQVLSQIADDEAKAKKAAEELKKSETDQN